MEASTFANNFWGKDDAGHTRLIQRMHHSKQTSEELLAFYKERQAIESEYARKLTGLSRKSLGTHETGTLRTSLDTLRKATETAARSHETLARQLGEQISTPLEAFASSIRERRKSSEAAMAKLTKAKQSQKQAVAKAKQRYEQECHRISGFQAQRNLLLGKDLDKNDAKLQQAQIQVEGLQREYQNALRALSETMEMWNSEWRQTCDRFQELETERVDFSKSNVWRYANAVSSVCVADDEECEAVRVALEKTDAATDIAEFATKHGTGSQIANAPAFNDVRSGFSTMDETFRQANFHSDEPKMSASISAPYLSVPSSRSHGNNRGSLTSEEEFRNSDRNSTFSSATSVSAYSPIQDSHQRFEPNNISLNQTAMPDLSHDASQSFEAKQQKRRSWAMPFKRQSSPDLCSAWKAVNNDQDGRERRDSLASSLRSSLLNQSSTERQQIPSNLAQTAQTGVDPLVAALERLKSPDQYQMQQTQQTQQMQQSQSFDIKRERRKSTGAFLQQRRPVEQQQQQQHQQQQQPVYTQNNANSALNEQFQRMSPYAQQQPSQARSAGTRPRSKSTVDLRGSSQLQAAAAYPAVSSEGHRVLRCAKAQYDYRAAIPEEVSFRKGDILLVLAMQEDGWWYTEVYGRGHYGLAPSNFLSSL